MLLSYHVFIKACLDLVGRRNLTDIKRFQWLRLLFFLFYLLLFWNTTLQVIQINKTDIRHILKIGHVLKI